MGSTVNATGEFESCLAFAGCTELDLSNQDLVGTIPPHIFLLESLTRL